MKKPSILRRIWRWLFDPPTFSRDYLRQLQWPAEGTSQPSPAALRQYADKWSREA